MVGDQRLRLDLWTRLARWVIRVPPLRARAMDIPVLAQRFAAALEPDASLTARLVERLVQHRFPGNVRELRGVIERLVVHARGARPIDVQPWLEAELAPRPADEPREASPAEADEGKSWRREAPQKDELVARLARLGGNVRAVALGYGVSRRTVYRWLEAAGVDPDDHR